MTAVRALLGTTRHARLNRLRVTAIVCLILVALLAVVQVTHVHAVANDADHCTLCVIMHSVAPIALMVAAIVLVRIGTPALALLEDRVIVRYWHPTLFTRPPPICF